MRRGGGGRGWKEEERRIEAGEGGSRETVSKNNFTGFLQPCIPQRGERRGSAAEQMRKRFFRLLKITEEVVQSCQTHLNHPAENVGLNQLNFITK